jgi:preprotein translocase subunit YajC
MMQALHVLAQGAPGGPAPAAAWFYQLAPMLLILVVFYFLLIAPMRKKQRELQSMIDRLQKGDRVITSGGLHGEIAGVEGAIVLLKIADQVKVKVSKSAITQVEDRGANT